MYEEVIEGLRKIAKDYKGRLTPYMRWTIFKAADAIEELQAGEKKFLRNISAIETENENLKRAGRWIPVTERLPDKYVSVWTYSKFGMLQDEYIGEYDGENYFARQTTHVTHWMPLPEPPKEET